MIFKISKVCFYQTHSIKTIYTSLKTVFFPQFCHISENYFVCKVFCFSHFFYSYSFPQFYCHFGHFVFQLSAFYLISFLSFFYKFFFFVFKSTFYFSFQKTYLNTCYLFFSILVCLVFLYLAFFKIKSIYKLYYLVY